MAVSIVIQPLGSSPVQSVVDGYANTLVTALNTPSSNINRQLADQSVAVVSASISTTATPPTDSSSSDFFSTPWHAGVIAAVVIVVGLLLIIAAVCLWKHQRKAVIGGVSAKPSGKYEHDLQDTERNKDADAHPAAAAEADSADAAVQMTDMARLNASADSEAAGETGAESDGKVSLKHMETDSEAEHFG